ncbi:MAG: hypothetical protein JO144_09160 [Actinobacteria bacterium]|nr:hypothetical protein [Actinomycetota bacterium]
MRSHTRSQLLAGCWVLALSAVLLWPQRLAGYGLGHDMVFTPRQPLTWQSLGLGSTSPRAVPLDALVALASRLLDGAVLGRIALAVPLLLAGWGCARLLRPASLPALLAVSGFAVWNPYVVERLALGQWALLWAYGALPWLVLAACRVRAATRLPAVAALLGWLACAAITPTGALIGAGVAVAVAWSRRLATLTPVLAAAVLVQLPWLVPALTSPAGATSDPRGVAAFAARPERPGGALGSLLGLGGIWSSDVTPTSRSGLLGYLTTAAVLAALVAGWPVLRAVLGQLALRLAGLAAAGLLLAVAGSLPGLAGVVRWAVRELPGAGLLRDGQKWLMPFVLLAVLAAGAAVQRAVDATAGRLPGWPVLLASLALPLALLPDAPATLRAPLAPVHYPAGWQQAADRVAGTGDAVLVLPFGSYRAYPWTPGRTVLDPAPRWLPAETVVDDRLAVGSTLLDGEDPAAARVAALLQAQPDAAALAQGLAGQGIGWVLVETDTPGPAVPDLGALRPVLTGGAVELYRVPGEISRPAPRTARRWAVLGADLAVAGAVLAALAVAARSRRRSQQAGDCYTRR